MKDPLNTHVHTPCCLLCIIVPHAVHTCFHLPSTSTSVCLLTFIYQLSYAIFQFSLLAALVKLLLISSWLSTIQIITCRFNKSDSLKLTLAFHLVKFKHVIIYIVTNLKSMLTRITFLLL